MHIAVTYLFVGEDHRECCIEKEVVEEAGKEAEIRP